MSTPALPSQGSAAEPFSPWIGRSIEDGVEIGRLASRRKYDTDVVVVGSGAGGAVTAARLAAAGLDVLIVEEGGFAPSLANGADPHEFKRSVYRDGGRTTIGHAPVLRLLEGAAVGGTTTIGSGMLYRMPGELLERWQQKSRVRAFSEDRLGGYYDTVESVMGAKPNAPPKEGRSEEFDVGVSFANAVAQLGQTALRAKRGADGCVGSNACYWGCATGAKHDAAGTWIAGALEAGSRLVTRARVTRLKRNAREVGGVVGVFAGKENGERSAFEVRAKLTVLAAGARHTPRILQRSLFQHPALGKSMFVSPRTFVVGEFDDDVFAWRGPHESGVLAPLIADGIAISPRQRPPADMVEHWNLTPRALGDLMVRYNRMIQLDCSVVDNGESSIDVRGNIAPSLDRPTLDRLARAAVLGAEILFKAGAKRVYTPIGETRLFESLDACKKHLTIFDPKFLVVDTLGLSGGCAMDARTDAGVCDGTGRVRGWSRLRVADASLLPGAPLVPPMATLMALALANAEAWLDDRKTYG